MRSYEERAKDFIKEIFPFLRDFESPWTTRQDVRMYNASRTRNVKVACGCARIALLTSDYVVKWDYDEDEVNAVGGSENEIALYEIAEKEGFAYLFAKITRYEYNGRKFYIMPRVNGIHDSNGRAWQYMTNAERAWCQNHYLTDLHCNNYGLVNHKVIIVDYGFQTDKIEDGSDSYLVKEWNETPVSED